MAGHVTFSTVVERHRLRQMPALADLLFFVGLE